MFRITKKVVCEKKNNNLPKKIIIFWDPHSKVTKQFQNDKKKLFLLESSETYAKNIPSLSKQFDQKKYRLTFKNFDKKIMYCIYFFFFYIFFPYL